MGIYTILSNLIVLGIVSVVLYIFRKSDKNSKSLEQVKKYASKRNEEFDLYIEEKMVLLGDLTVALEVQEKTGAVILNKISGEVDVLSDKISHIEELNKKVTGYNSTMDKMLNLSKELDERYSKLKKDSSYIDVLDKKVKDGKKKLSLIEKNIDDITSEFIKNNNNSINILKEEVLSTTNEKADELGLRINNSSIELDNIKNLITELNVLYDNTSKENYDNFRDDLNKLIDSHRLTVVKITQEGENIEEESFQNIKNKILQRSTSLTSILDNNLKIIEEENDEKISKLSMDMGNVELIANNIKSENEGRLNSIKEQLDNQLVMLKDANSKGVSALQEEFSINFAEFKEVSLSEIDKSKKETENLLTELKEDLDNAKDFKHEIVNRYATAEDYINNEISDLKDRLESSVLEVTRELESHEDKIKDEAFKHLEDNLYLYKDEVDKKLEELTSVTSTIDGVKKDVSNKISDVGSNLQEQLLVIQSNITSEKEQILLEVDNLKNNYSELRVENTELISLEKNSFTEGMLSLKNQQDVLRQELLDNEKEIRTQLSTYREQIIHSTNTDIETRLDDIKDELFNKITRFSTFDSEIEKARLDLEDKILLSKTSIESKYSEFTDKTLLFMEEESKNLEVFVNEFNIVKSELSSEIVTLKESSYNNISEKLNIFEDEYFLKLKDKEIYIETETEKWKNNLDVSVNNIKDESIASIIENMEDVNGKVNSFKDNLQNNYNSFRDETEIKINTLISNMQNEENKLKTDCEAFKTNLNSDIKVLTEQLNIMNSSISDDSKILIQNIDKISKEQQKYISETEIFSRTDKLREELSIALVNINSNISDVKEKSDFINTTNDKLNSLRNIIDNINTQIEGVDQKRIKIETLEGRVSKVLELSDSVDDKLTQIKNSEAQVVEIQLRLRELKELEENVTQEFSRLEKKEELLSETNRAIDSGFSQIQMLENKMDVLNGVITPFHNQIDNIKDKLIKVEERETKVNKAIDTLSVLDNSINNMEDKIVKMDKAREWIAGVETRLDVSVRTAEEQVKLMGALAQNNNSPSTTTGSVNAPNMNMRDMVIKLAHQGWKSDAIAKTTKLSRGEVELILELSPRK